MANNDLIKHGTSRGHYLCAKRPEGACEDCQNALRDYHRGRSKAYTRALSRLRQIHPALFDALLTEELARVAAEKSAGR